MKIEELTPKERRFRIELTEAELLELRSITYCLWSEHSVLGSVENYNAICEALGGDGLDDGRLKKDLYFGSVRVSMDSLGFYKEGLPS